MYNPIGKIAALIAAALFAGLVLFQLALAFGAPWGRAAYGGFVEQPGTELRVESAIATIVWSVAGLTVLKRAGFAVWTPVPRRAVPVVVWAVVGLTALGIAPNVISPSALERAIWLPVVVAMTALTLTVAISSRRRDRALRPVAKTP